VVVTNPPFSLFREYVAQLMEYKKKFLIIGSLNAITYKEIFPLLKDNKMWVGYNNGAKEYIVPNYYEIKENGYREENGVKYCSMGNTGWFTNLNITKRHENLLLYKKYNEVDYPKYDNYDAINVNKIKDIPQDYNGEIGVPITFMDKYNPEQFEILECSAYSDKKKYGAGSLYVNSGKIYARIVIKRKVQP
jgi:Adenine-specific methyltransferase EcoRI